MMNLRNLRNLNLRDFFQVRSRNGNIIKMSKSHIVLHCTYLLTRLDIIYQCDQYITWSWST